MKKLSLLLLFFLGVHSSWAQSIAFEDPVNVYVSSNDLRNYKFDDVTGDGINDLIIVQIDSIIILKGNADKKTHTRLFARKADIGGSALGVEDFNNDGYKDILYVSGNNGIKLILNKQGTDFEQPQYYNSGRNFAKEFAIADFNKDGYLDVALPHGHDLDPCYFLMSVYMNNKNGTLSNQVIYGYPFVHDQCNPLGKIAHGYISAVDVNDDDYLDLVLTIIEKDSLLVSYNQGNTQGFQFDNLVNTRFPREVKHAYVFDIDLDGRDDVIGVCVAADFKANGKIDDRYYYSNILTRANGNNELVFDVAITPQEKNNENVAISVDPSFVDLNGDGEKDIFFVKDYYYSDPNNSNNKYNLDSFTVHYNKGKGVFDLLNADVAFKVPSKNYRFTNEWYNNVVDINDDGLSDILYVVKANSDPYMIDSINVLYQKKKEVVITGEQEKLLDQDAQIYLSPNPSSAWVTLITSVPMQKLLVYNVQGMQILEQDVYVNKVEFNTSAWAKGLYQIKVISVQGKVYAEKLIIE
jgi:hypothetical protein